MRSIRSRTALIFILGILPVLMVSFVLGSYGRILLEDSATVFENSRDLRHVRDQLEMAQEVLELYLSQGGTDTLREVFIRIDGLKKAVGPFESQVSEKPFRLSRRTIFFLVIQYINQGEEAIKAKRGRFYDDVARAFSESERIKTLIIKTIDESTQREISSNLGRYFNFLKYFSRFQSLSSLLILIVILMSMVFIVFFSKLLADPIIALSEASQELAKGNFEVPDIHPRGIREVEVLASAYNAMKSSIRLHIGELQKKAEIEIQNLQMTNLLKLTELMALQGQINPHFMFNTLNAGLQLAVVEGADKTADFIDHLAEVFRYSMNKIEEDTSLGDELESLKNFIYIMRIRFGDRIAYSLEVDPAFHHLRVPSMILQPLVENSISHGLKHQESGGRISLRAWQKGEDVYLAVEDNGTGIEPHRIQEILEYDLFQEIQDPDHPRKGVGLVNVIQRFRIFYGREHLVQIRGSSEEGTSVVLCIPGVKES